MREKKRKRGGKKYHTCHYNDCLREQLCVFSLTSDETSVFIQFHSKLSMFTAWNTKGCVFQSCGGTFHFTFQVFPSYPHEPPKVKCKTKVYDLNSDLEGNVCLNILREDWKPVLNINTFIYGLNHLFTVVCEAFTSTFRYFNTKDIEKERKKGRQSENFFKNKGMKKREEKKTEEKNRERNERKKKKKRQKRRKDHSHYKEYLFNLIQSF